MEIRAFNGWRFGRSEVSQVIAPPYDILSAQDKKAMLAVDASNIVAVDMPQVPPTAAGPDAVYAGAAKLLAQWKASGVMARDARPALYAYQQDYVWAGKAYSRRAMLCGVRATPFGQDVIPHEHTFAGPKADRLKLTQHTRMQLSPIFGFYRDPRGAASDLLWTAAKGDPDACGMLRGVTEKLWVIQDAGVIRRVAAILKTVPVFIADGHHRYTTAMNYRDALKAAGKIDDQHEANYVMFALVDRDDPGLLILPTHRIVRGLRAGFTVAKLAAGAKEFSWQRLSIEGFDFRNAGDALKRFGPHAMAVVGASRSEVWIARLNDAKAMDAAAPAEALAWRQLDVAILHKLILERALSPWLASEPAIEYTPDALKVQAACQSLRAPLGVCLQGTPIEAVEQIALAGAAMPHKSTYFYPKLATGMVLKPLG